MEEIRPHNGHHPKTGMGFCLLTTWRLASGAKLEIPNCRNCKYLEASQGLVKLERGKPATKVTWTACLDGRTE